MASFWISVGPDLREEISHWLFLDDWVTPFPWFPERHFILRISSDSSDYKWAAIYHSDKGDIICSDFWSDEEKRLPIMVKEALALLYALGSLGSCISNKRISAQVDNMALIHAWEGQYSKNSDLNKALKSIFKVVFQNNALLTLTYISSADNPSDFPSRSISKSDATISTRTWFFIQHMFGPHSVDMFSLDSNAMVDSNGKMLRHFTPYPTPNYDGVDAFAQPLSTRETYFAFPPFILIPAVVRFIIQEHIKCTIVFPDFHPSLPWYNIIVRNATHIAVVGYAGDKGVLLFPAKSGYRADKQGLHWNLLAAQFTPRLPSPLFYHHQRCPPIHIQVLFTGDSMI